MPAGTLRWHMISGVAGHGREQSWHVRLWSRSRLCLALLALVPLLVAAPSVAQQPPPDAPVPVVPVAPSLVETPAATPERLLAPVPQQFNWLGREASGNPLLEALLGVQTPARLTVSTSLTQEVSDNFAHQPDKGPVDARTGVALSTVYRVENEQSFLSLANTVRAFYQARTGREQIGFANVALSAGYQAAPFSFGLTDSFVRDDATGQGANPPLLNLTQGTTTTAPLNASQGATTPLLRTRDRFIRNTVSPQVRYDITPITSTTFGYTNTLVIDEDGNQDSVSHSATAGAQHQFSPLLTGNAQYGFTTSSGAGAVGGHSQRLSAGLGYALDIATSLSLSAFGTLVERRTTGSTTGERDVHSYGASLGVRRVLFEPVSLFASVGPTIFKRQGESERFRVNWQVSLDGPIPLFNTPELTLTLSTTQNVQDTTSELTDVGVVLRQTVAAALNYRPAPFFAGAAFVSYTRDELLESSGSAGTASGRKDNFWSAGLNASYALTRIISLTGIYSYQRRDTSGARNDFDENRLTVAVTGTFPIF